MIQNVDSSENTAKDKPTKTTKLKWVDEDMKNKSVVTIVGYSSGCTSQQNSYTSP